MCKFFIIHSLPYACEVEEGGVIKGIRRVLGTGLFTAGLSHLVNYLISLLEKKKEA